ncbi:MAG: hypothetical protein J7L77_10130, partial [Clostridiales bacterium]|nr:hypothetical protein [Clostridiales bacterium]
MKINIIVPFTNSKTMVPIWAFDEDIIDFRNQHEFAARCTCSYAAIELEKYLKKTLSNVDIGIDESFKNDVELNINLIIENYNSRDSEFFMQPKNNEVTISGKGRTGLLYGVYEFLRLQGWRWHSLDNDGDLKSTTLNDLVLPTTKESFKPSMNKGMGFDFGQGYSKESIRLWKWMSRNRLNIAGYRENTAALCNKLGMQYKNGGHIFEKCLDPDRILTSGKTIWEEHKNWYGQGPNGYYSKDAALSLQFCVSNDKLIDFLGNYLLQYLTGEWKYADRIDIWGFDTWGQTCNCKNCQALGNSTDQNLHFISKMRNFLNSAKANNKLDHDVSMIFCGYEGTCTLQGPTKPIPQNIIDAGDMMVYAPIRKCYAHDFSDESCKMNKFYKDALESWFNKQSNLPIIIGEFY